MATDAHRAPGGTSTVVLVVAAAALVAGYLLPWITLRFATERQSYSPSDLPVLGWIGGTWISLVLLAALASRISGSRVVTLAAAAIASTSAACGLITCALIWRVPHLLPMGFIPARYRNDAPTVGASPGVFLLAVAGTVIMGWEGWRLLVVWRRHRSSPSGPAPATTSARAAIPPTFGPVLTTPGASSPDDDIWSDKPWL
jgi:hypothetical protein